MSTATLNIRVKEQRLVSTADAAHYCGLKPKRFKVDCPVRPIRMGDDSMLYDKRDLDAWVDSLKGGALDSDDEIIGKLL